MKRVLISLIRFYGAYLSLERGAIPRALGVRRATCAFYPTCSVYAEESVARHGALKGSYKALRRVLRCHPWSTPAVDLVE